MNTLSNFDILDILKEYNLNYYFGGIFSKDKLPPILKRNKFYIINLDDEKGAGTHWTALYYNKPLDSIYFDPFGFVAPVDVERIIKPYFYNDDQIQNIETSSCGFYCIAFIKFLHDKQDKKAAFKMFIKLFKMNTIENEKVLYHILYK